MKPRPEWTDRRIWNYGLLVFTSFIVCYAVIWHPLAPESSLVSMLSYTLVWACVSVILGYTVGRLAGKHRALKGEKDEKSQLDW